MLQNWYTRKVDIQGIYKISLHVKHEMHESRYDIKFIFEDINFSKIEESLKMKL